MPDPLQTPLQLATLITDFLTQHPHALLTEEGKVLFDFRQTKYTLTTDNRCTLHLWSDDRNLVRRILTATPRAKTLRLTTQKFGQSKPTLLELLADQDRRTPSTREATRTRYLRTLERTLDRHHQDDHWHAKNFSTAMDLEKSFGPAYARGLLTRATQSWAVIAVNQEESPATIDGILTFGLLWLTHCRERQTILGLYLILPPGHATLTLTRLPWLLGTFRLATFDQRAETLTDIPLDGPGNLATRLLHAPNPITAASRFAASQATLMALIPPAFHSLVEPHLRSTTELAFLLHGLEFARIRLTASATSFNRLEQITFGAGPAETALTPETEPALRTLLDQLFHRRTPTAARRDPLYRLQPERWLESQLRRDLTLLDPHLLPTPIYTQVPAFQADSASFDRGMIDLLALTDTGRLALFELKADEDPQLALQGLDYWIRVRYHHTQPTDPQTGLGAFQSHGFFPTHRLSPEDPILYLVAPALRLHPATEIILRHFSPRIPWLLLALDERWRQQIKVVFRKRPTDTPSPHSFQAPTR